MDTVVLVLRLVLATTFTVSALSKMFDLGGTRQAVEDFGAPVAISGPLVALLPIAELTVVGLLLFGHTAVAGSILALALLAVFSIAIAFNLRRGRRPDCHCFGQIGSGPIGARTLGRNAGIAAIAVLVAGIGLDDAGPSPAGWLGDLDGTELAVLVLGVAVAAAIAGGARLAIALLRQRGRPLLRVDQLETAPDFSLPAKTPRRTGRRPRC